MLITQKYNRKLFLELGKALEKARIEKGWTVEQAAAQTGFNTRTIIRYEKYGNRWPACPLINIIWLFAVFDRQVKIEIAEPDLGRVIVPDKLFEGEE